MRSMKNRNLVYQLLLVQAIIFFSCKEKSEYHSLNEKIKEEQTPYHGSLTSEELLANTELIEVTEGEFTFLIPERKGEIKSFSCLECHNRSLNNLQDVEGKKAHWDITLKHTNSEVMNCATCHNGNDMDNLQGLTGQSIDFNMGHKLCAQCHFSQFEDWKGGAHGKKVAGWVPPRASMTCVNCHNPHDPTLEKRWPVQFNTQMAIERQENLDH